VVGQPLERTDFKEDDDGSASICIISFILKGLASEEFVAKMLFLPF
jgi:hypothetical protein